MACRLRIADLGEGSTGYFAERLGRTGYFAEGTPSTDDGGLEKIGVARFIIGKAILFGEPQA